MTLYTIIVFDHHRNGVPVAWIIISSSYRIDIVHWFKAFRNVMQNKYKSWAPNALLVDDVTSETDAIRYVQFDLLVLAFDCIYSHNSILFSFLIMYGSI
jgi:hypothetical protein